MNETSNHPACQGSDHGYYDLNKGVHAFLENDPSDPMRFRTKYEHATHQLRKMLLQGRWEEVIPGYRMLCDELGVSRNHITAALEQLTEEGLLAPAEPGKARHITALATEKKTISPEDQKKVLLLGPCPWDELPYATISVLRKIREQSNLDDFSLTYTHLDMIGRKKLGSQVDRLINSHQASILLLVTPTANLVLHAKEIGIPFFCLGGEIPLKAGKVEGAFVESHEMIRMAMLYLISRGHRKILCPLQVGREIQKEELWKLFTKDPQISLTQETFHFSFPLQDMTHPEVLASFWEQRLSQNAPTAVIVQDFSGLLSLYQFCNQHHLSIPQDISVIALFDHPYVPWLSSELSRFIVPTQKMTRHILDWMDRITRDPLGYIVIPPEAIEGTTVADLR